MEQMTRISRSSRNVVSLRRDYPLGDDQIINVAPSVFAEEKHESRGERYAFISTAQVLEGLRREGFQPYEVRQTKVRDQGKRAHTKHLLRLRHPDVKATPQGVPEILLLNSHDGTSSYRLMSGYFRYVCDNGLVFGDFASDVKIRHSGKVVNDVIEGAFRVVDSIAHDQDIIEEMRSFNASTSDRLLLAETARQIRWAGADHIPVESQQLIVPRRFEDRAPDIWTQFNVVQENTMKGGVAGRTSTNRNTSTREVTSVSESVRINRALWQMAEAFSGMKSGRVDPREFQQRLLNATPDLSEVL